MMDDQMLPMDSVRFAVEYIKQRQPLLRPGLNDSFMTWRFFEGRYFNGYPCPPCPNCGDETMWYREYAWRYGQDNRIEHGKRCERCWHHWNPETGEVWLQGTTRAQVRREWAGIYEPPDAD